MRIVHSIGTYLNLTENWVAPQVLRVPGVEGRVLCTTRANANAFQIPHSHIAVDPVAKIWPPQLAWRLEAIGQRRGINRFRNELRVRRWAPDILHAHFGTRAWENRALAKRLGVPLVASFYGYDAWLLPQEQPAWRTRYEDLFATAALVVVEGPAMRDRLLSLKCPPEKVIVHRIGADLSSLNFVERDFSNTVRVVMVGRFVEKKGLPDGLRACAMARENGLDIRITVIGDATPNDAAGHLIRQELHSLADAPALNGRVHFTGFISAQETAAVLRDNNVLLCPSHHAANGDAEGGSPVVLTEAMASGMLCIGTNHCDIPELITDNVTGRLCSERDVVSMAQLLLETRSNEQACVPMTREGRRHIEANFNLGSQLTRMKSLYDDVVTLS